MTTIPAFPGTVAPARRPSRAPLASAGAGRAILVLLGAFLVILTALGVTVGTPGTPAFAPAATGHPGAASPPVSVPAGPVDRALPAGRPSRGVVPAPPLKGFRYR